MFHLINYAYFQFIINEKKKRKKKEKKRKVQVVHDDEQQEKKNKQHSKTRSQETKLKEDINSEREEQSVKPQQQDHSKRLRWHKTFNSSNDFSLSSKERRFRSNHTIHIKHPRTKLQMSKLCFPSHWCQQDNKPATDLGITQWIPKAWNIKVQREWVTGQWRRRWSTDSPSQQYIQHQVANEQPLSIKLSKVRIWPCATVHKKNATRLGIFGFQTPFQGNKEFEAPRIAW